MSQYGKQTFVVRSDYDGSRVAVVVECTAEEGRTKQSFKESADINSVLARYARTGVWTRVARTPLFGDVSFMEDYHTALNRVLAAQDDVRRLPERAKELYDEDPAGYLDRVVDARSRDALVDLGLLEAAETPPAADKPPVAQ